MSSSVRVRADSPEPGRAADSRSYRNSSRPRPERLEVRVHERVLTRSSRGVSRSRSTDDRPPADSSFILEAISTARDSSVYGSENFMLSESSRIISRCDLTVSRWLLTSTGSTSMAARASSVSIRRPTRAARFGRDRSAALAPVEPPEQGQEHAPPPAITATAPVPCGSAVELEPRRRPPAPHPGDGSIPRSICKNLFIG